MPNYLALDQGTHSTRACVFDHTGRLIDSHSKKISLRRINNIHIEQDAEEILDSVKCVMTDAMDACSGETLIATCGIATQRSSVLAWRNDGTVLSPVLSWQDTRGQAQVERLISDETEIRRLSGLPLSAHYGASKLHLLQEMTAFSDGDVRLSPLISYLLFHLLQEHPYIVDHANAQRTQLFALDDMDWSPRLTELFAVSEAYLPTCVPVSTSLSRPHGHLIESSIPLCAINGDQNAAVYSNGRPDFETVLVNIGSGAFVLSLLPGYSSSDRQLTGISKSDTDIIQYVREATINGAANALTWLENKHQIKEIWRQLHHWLDEVEYPPVFINTIGGLGSPWWRNDIEAEFICKDDADPDLPSQAVAVIESIIFMIWKNIELMQTKQTISCLRVSGGLSNLDGLCQGLADLTGLIVKRKLDEQATARGVAWLASGTSEIWSGSDETDFIPRNDEALTDRYQLFVERLIARLR